MHNATPKASPFENVSVCGAGSQRAPVPVKSVGVGFLASYVIVTITEITIAVNKNVKQTGHQLRKGKNL